MTTIISADRADRIATLAKQGIDLAVPRPTMFSHPLWTALRKLGSELSKDTK